MVKRMITIVIPEPQVNVVDGEYRFAGKAVPVWANGNTLSHLMEAGAYDSRADAANWDVSYTDKFSIEDRLGEVDEVLDLIDGPRLKTDLDEDGYAFLRTKEQTPKKFRDYRDKKLIASTDRVIQDLVYQQLPERFPEAFPDESTARHFKTQESVELIYSNEKFKTMLDGYWMHNLEVIQRLAEKKSVYYKMEKGDLVLVETESENLIPVGISSVGSGWSLDESRPAAISSSPLCWYVGRVAALKRVEPTVKESRYVES